MCPTCNSLYSLEDVTKRGSSMKCSTKTFGKVCGRDLCYQKYLAFGRSKWAPFNINFIPLSAWLKKMFQNQHFASFLGAHIERHTRDGVFEDLWDGRI